MNMKKWILGAFAALGMSVATAAQPVGPYIGILGGSTKVSIADEEPVYEDEEYEYFLDYATKKFTGGLFAGWQITEYLGIEAGYNKVWKINEELIEGDPSAKISLKLNTINASVIGTFPFGDTWSVFGRAGASRVSATVGGYVDGDLVAREKAHSTEFQWGAGVGVIFEGARVRLEYSQIKDDGAKLGLTSLGIVWFLPHAR